MSPVAVPCQPVSSPSRPFPRSGRLLSTITEPTSAAPAPCDPSLVEETSSSPPVSEESEVDRTDHSGIKKVCFKVSEDEQEDSGHDTMSYRDSYRCVRPTGGHRTTEASDLWESQDCGISQDEGHQSLGLTMCVWWGGDAGPGASDPLRGCSTELACLGPLP